MDRRDGGARVAALIMFAGAVLAPVVAAAQPREVRWRVNAGAAFFVIKGVHLGDGVGFDAFDRAAGVVGAGLDVALGARVDLTARVDVVAPVGADIGLSYRDACPRDRPYPQGLPGHAGTTTLLGLRLGVGARVRPFARRGRYYLGGGAFLTVLMGEEGGPYRNVCSAEGLSTAPDVLVERGTAGLFAAPLLGGALETGILLGPRQEVDLGVRVEAGASPVGGGGDGTLGGLYALAGWRFP